MTKVTDLPISKSEKNYNSNRKSLHIIDHFKKKKLNFLPSKPTFWVVFCVGPFGSFGVDDL